MENGRYNLINSLCNIITYNSPDSSEYILAEYFLRHYGELNQLNIFTVAEECFISRSSIRRFCQSIGFHNFKDLKHQFTNYDDIQGIHLFESKHLYHQSRLQESINTVLTALNIRMGEPDTDELLSSIQNSASIMFYCMGFAEHIAREYQHEMIHYKKVVYVSSNRSFIENWMQQATANDLLITISTSGNFSKTILPFPETFLPKKILLIISNSSDHDRNYDFVYHLASNMEEPPLDIYARYGITYFFDLLVYLYEHKYWLHNETNISD